MDTSSKYKANRTEIIRRRGNIRGNNSLIPYTIFTKVASCTSAPPNGHFCQVKSESDRNPRSSCPDKHFKVKSGAITK